MLLTPLTLALPADAPLRAVGLQTEFQKDPRGIDAPRPRLSWYLSSAKRGDHPTAYQIIAAATKAEIVRNRGALWNSEKILSRDVTVRYGGKLLNSGAECYWKVRVWDAEGKPGPWSRTASWSMGLLHRSDWKARWITSPTLADPANRPRTPINCYRSELTDNPNTPKWVAIDLGKVRSIDRISLAPARPNGLTYDIGTVQFPKRFRIVASKTPEFSQPKILVDQTQTEFPQPRKDACDFNFSATDARYIRLEVTQLGGWDAHDYGIFLAQFSAYRGGENASVGAAVTASDSIETEHWSKKFLTDGHPRVEFSTFPTALDPKVPGAFSPSRTTMLRRDLVLDAPIKKATLYGTARGFYEARINGHRVSKDLLAPGFTDYHLRQTYATHDVTALLHQGPNTVAALLGYGWYAGHMNLAGNAYFYGYFPQFAAQLDIELANGKHLTVATDKQWQTTLDGPVRWSDLLDGEASDLRKDLPGWDKPGFDTARWQPAWSQPLGKEKLVGQKMSPVRAIREMKPVSRKQVRPGVWVYDLGQEITGWVRLRANGPSGTHIVIRHAEAVKPDGELDVSSLWGTLQQDDYLLDGKGPRTLEPHFTYHGFRYFEVSGLDSPDDVVAINLHNDFEEVGQFDCSNPVFNRLMTASKWTQRNLFFDVPAGCAARSERLAWTGDIRPCVQTALFNFDTAGFFEKYAADLRDDQKPDGRFTDITPHAHLMGTEICVGSPGWADAGVSLPWELYVNTGDRQVLADHYEAAKRWVDFIDRQNPDHLWRNGRGMDWGDWLSAGRATPKEIGSTAFFAHSTNLLSRMAQALGKKSDAKKYGDLFTQIKSAFAAHYVSPEGIIRLPQTADVKSTLQKLAHKTITVGNETFGIDPAPNTLKKLVLKIKIDGKIEIHEYAEGQKVDLKGEILEASYGASGEDAQGSYALALHFDLLSEPVRSKAIERLSQVIQRDGNHPATGFWSSLELLLALSDNGHHEQASQLANLTTAPSWGHMVSGGGTTFWEAFDADQKTLSLNHWTHSACGEWLWRNVAGLSPKPENPGYQTFTIRPRPTAEVTWCKASFRSPRGPIKIDWKAENGHFTLNLQVPPGSVAEVYLPGASDSKKGVRFLRQERGEFVYRVESGNYQLKTTPRLK